MSPVPGLPAPLKGGGKSGNSGKTLSNCLVHGDLRKTMEGSTNDHVVE